MKHKHTCSRVCCESEGSDVLLGLIALLLMLATAAILSCVVYITFS